MSAEKFLQLKKEIENSKIEKAKLKGQLESNLKQLKDEFNVDTVEEAEELLKIFEKDLIKIQKDIQKESEKIEDLLEE